MSYTAQQLIDLLHLQPHPEGGWFAFRETSGRALPAEALPGFSGSRDTCSYIYYLLQRGEISALAAETEIGDDAGLHEQVYGSVGEIFRASAGGAERKLQYQIGAASQSRLRPRIFVEHGGDAPLNIVSAHGDDNKVCSGDFPCAGQMICMAAVERIVFCDDAGDGHGGLLSVAD